MSDDTTTANTRPGPRGGTITWGIILLAIAGLSIAGALVDPTLITGTTILWAIAGVGGLIIVGAIVAAVIRSAAKKA